MNFENNLILADSPVRITEVGLTFNAEVSFDQWCAIGEKVGRFAKSSLFLVGDWLIYGQNRWNGGERFEKMPPEQAERYLQAMSATGLELRTLMDAAYVARNIPIEQRRPKLTFEHHKTVAKVRSEDKREQWLSSAEKQKLSTRRLRQSINAGRVVKESEIKAAANQPAIRTHIPAINELQRWWKSFAPSGWIESATREQIDAMLADFRPMRDILDTLDCAAEDKEPVLPC